MSLAYTILVMQPKRYHMGIRGRVARSTLADANETRDWRIVAAFAQGLIAIAKPLHATEPLGVDLQATVYAFDSTTIDPCLALFPWARFRQVKGAIKPHTLLDLRGNIPEVVYISDGKRADVTALDSWSCCRAPTIGCRISGYGDALTGDRCGLWGQFDEPVGRTRKRSLTNPPPERTVHGETPKDR